MDDREEQYLKQDVIEIKEGVALILDALADIEERLRVLEKYGQEDD
jgi:hypothetical protein